MKNRTRKGIKDNILIFGTKGTGKVFFNIKPIVPTGEELLNSLLINGKYANYYTRFTNIEILQALQRCKRKIVYPCCDTEIWDSGSFSARQANCAIATIELIMRDKYNDALHELEDCIDNMGEGKNKYLTGNELVLYNCIITCFVNRLEEQLR